MRQAEAQAKIEVAKAEGEAQALRIKADGEAYYNRTVAASLNGFDGCRVKNLLQTGYGVNLAQACLHGVARRYLCDVGGEFVVTTSRLQHLSCWQPKPWRY